MTDELPTGNVDVAPTILWILGVQPAENLDGRVLYEAVAGAPVQELKTSEARLLAERNEQGTHWRQYLKFTQLGPHNYLDEGNRETSEAPKQN